jgi:hypothetical protein
MGAQTAGEARLVPYYFDVHGYGEHHENRGGTLMTDDAAALAYALRMIRELRSSGGYDDDALTLVVRDASGRTLFRIPFLQPEYQN